ncbi:MAG: dTDP-4-dehydrorhamnose 3,5-epimerase [Novosphingobium sp.]|nr:dTDP-4-dehydrorhamnose 3,5-epimerase [Novosphingobium sp.]
MELIPTAIEGVMIVEPKVFGDDRGFFMESWSAAGFAAKGLDLNFVQDNHSRSSRGVLRGLHYQQPGPQGKLVRVTAGAVYDVAVDLRKSSPTFGNWVGVKLSAANKRMLWVPEGMAHGFLALEDGTDFLYKCTAPYRPDAEHSLLWNDPVIGIDWPLDGIEPQLSAKDRAGVPLADAVTFA